MVSCYLQWKMLYKPNYHIRPYLAVILGSTRVIQHSYLLGTVSISLVLVYLGGLPIGPLNQPKIYRDPML